MNKVEKYKSIVLIISYILIVFIVLYQVFSKPLFGIANNGDFQRFSQKIGVDYKEDPWTQENYGQYFWSYVTDDYKIIEPRETGFFSSHEYLGKLAVFFDQLFNYDDSFNLRFMGLVNSIFYLFGVALIFLFFRNRSLSDILLFSILGILFFPDKEVVQFFNSFYTESGSLIFLLIYIGLNLLYTKIPLGRRSLRVTFLFLEIFLIYLFLGAKLQNVLGLLPMIILFCVKLYLLFKERFKRWFSLFFAIFLSILCVLIPNVFFFSENTESSSNIVSFNVIMMEILEQSSKPKEHLKNFGFPKEDIDILVENIGCNAYSCPELFGTYGEFFDRKKELNILLNEPYVIWKLMEKQGSRLSESLALGNYDGTLGKDSRIVATDFAHLEVLRENLYYKNFYFFLGILSLYSIVLIKGLRKNLAKNSRIVYFLLLSVPVYIALFFATSILGDSGHDLVKHFWLQNVLFDFVVIFLICFFIEKVCKRFGLLFNVPKIPGIKIQR